MEKFSFNKFKKSALVLPLSIVCLAELVVILALLVKLQIARNERFAFAFGTDKSTAELLDSVTASLPKETLVLAKFTDQSRHAMYYVKDGQLNKFDILTRESHAIPISDKGNRWEILTADLAPNDSSVIIIALNNNDTMVNGLFKYTIATSNMKKLGEGSVNETDEGYEIMRKGRRKLFDKYGEQIKEPERTYVPVAVPDSTQEEQLPPPAEYEGEAAEPAPQPQTQQQTPPPAEPATPQEPAEKTNTEAQ